MSDRLEELLREAERLMRMIPLGIRKDVLSPVSQGRWTQFLTTMNHFDRLAEQGGPPPGSACVNCGQRTNEGHLEPRHEVCPEQPCQRCGGERRVWRWFAPPHHPIDADPCRALEPCPDCAGGTS